MGAVRVTANCAVAYNYGVYQLVAGEVIPAGEFADHLAAGGAPVEPVNRPEPEAPADPDAVADEDDPDELVDLPDPDAVPEGTVDDGPATTRIA